MMLSLQLLDFTQMILSQVVVSEWKTQANITQDYQGDLDKFFKHYTDIPVGTSPIFKSIDGGVRPPNSTHAANFLDVGGEADLDLQCALPIIYPQNATIFQTDDRHWAEETATNYSFGIFNTFLDAIDGSYCTYSAFGETGNDPDRDPVYPDNRTHGYQGELQCGVYQPPNVISLSYAGLENMVPYAYQKRQCNEYLKLGLQGVSLFFSSGDDGAGPCAAHDRVFVTGQPNGCPYVYDTLP